MSEKETKYISEIYLGSVGENIRESEVIYIPWKGTGSRVKTLFKYVSYVKDRLCGLVVRVHGYRSGGLGFDSRALQEKEVVSLERGPLSLVSTTEELLARNSSGSRSGRRDSSRRPRGTLYPQKS
jgi:hypothetical protein